MSKMFFDIIFSGIGLLLLSPLLIIVSGMMLIFDGRPIFFRQARVGINGTDFILYKFRTMRVERGAASGTFDAGDSSRITKIGAFLRKTKLDELPQLWNVFKGDMSLVGPRPEVRKWVDAYPQRWAKVLTVKPGITDPASIYYRNEEELLARSDDPVACYRDQILPHKLDFYEEYVRTRTFWGDISLIVKTFIAVIFPRYYSCQSSYNKTEIPSSLKKNRLL